MIRYYCLAQPMRAILTDSILILHQHQESIWPNLSWWNADWADKFHLSRTIYICIPLNNKKQKKWIYIYLWFLFYYCTTEVWDFDILILQNNLSLILNSLACFAFVQRYSDLHKIKLIVLWHNDDDLLPNCHIIYHTEEINKPLIFEKLSMWNSVYASSSTDFPCCIQDLQEC